MTEYTDSAESTIPANPRHRGGLVRRALPRNAHTGRGRELIRREVVRRSATYDDAVPSGSSGAENDVRQSAPAHGEGIRAAWYGHEAWRRESGEPVDAEILEEDAPQVSWRETLGARARSAFGGSAEERVRERERVIALDLERSAATEEGPQERGPALLGLRSEIRLAEDSYLGWVRDTNLLGKARSEKKMDAMQAIYMQRMMHSMMKPLSQNVDAASVVQVVGTMSAMALLSPDFRHEIGKYAAPVKAAVLQRVENSAASNKERYSALMKDGTASDRDRKRHDMWAGRLERIQFAARGKRQPHDVRSAALTEVGLMQNCFSAMRAPGADREKVMGDYKVMKDSLRKHVAEDGIDFDEVTSEIRTIVGERMEFDPEVRVMFEGLSHGRMVKGHLREVRLAGTQKTRKVWDGDFETHLGKTLLKDGGRFVVRPPMTAEEHQVRITETMVRAMGDALHKGDRERFGASAAGYMVGFQVAGKDIDPPPELPELLRDRMRDANTISGSMVVDGLSREQIRDTYSFAYLDAIQELSDGGYDMNEEFAQAFGPDWESRLSAAGANPMQFFAEEQMRRRAQEDFTEQAKRPTYYADTEGSASRGEDLRTDEHQPA